MKVPVKDLMNGAPLPNWVKLVALGAFLGIQAGLIWQGQRDAVATLAVGQKEIVGELKAINGTISVLDNTLTRRSNQANVEHRRMWKAIGKPEEVRNIE